jgi:hypothetical protein
MARRQQQLHVHAGLSKRCRQTTYVCGCGFHAVVRRRRSSQTQADQHNPPTRMYTSWDAHRRIDIENPVLPFEVSSIAENCRTQMDLYFLQRRLRRVTPKEKRRSQRQFS